MNRLSSYIIILTGIFVFTSCKQKVEYGVSVSLAEQRKQAISNIEYNIYIDIPASVGAPIPGRIEISFELSKQNNLPIDFRSADSSLLNVTANFRQINPRIINGHIIIPKSALQRGQNRIAVDFIAGSTSLNRKEDFLFSLLVPDRASTVFPCFDQPDLKARYSLTLQTPKGWVAVGNSPVVNRMETDSSTLWMFNKTEPISTYLFAFAAGKFDTLCFDTERFKMVMYHRETDTLKVKRNATQIFNLHQSALKWLEEYTGIAYPFQKLDIVLIPDFPYSGMEHPGAIFYRDNRILLDENPSVNQLLSRANLIAHEVSHQWFGNLVTMNWFNDVWLKEVFAGLMADKIVNPQYPNINHQLSFILSHYPRAYSVDRTSGANPIRQRLDNLILAGTLYGDIIYHKAPIALQQLELMMGPDRFREGLQHYLNRFAYSNAGWPELIDIFDGLSDQDISTWNQKWIETPGMPVISYEISDDKLIFNQSEHWLPMQLSILFPKQESQTEQDARLSGKTTEIQVPLSPSVKQNVIVNSNGIGYGLFLYEKLNCTLLQPQEIRGNDVARASFYINLHEQFLNHFVDNETYFRYLTNAIAQENEPQIRNYLLGNLETVWWQFLNPANRIMLAQTLEETLMGVISNQKIAGDERKPAFLTYSRTATSKDATELLERIWDGKTILNGITLSETDYINLSYELAVREVQHADSILQVQESRIQNPDRLAKFRFVRRAVTPDEALRDDFFHSLFHAANRRPEPWVAEGLRYFFHPLRAYHSINYLNAALDLLPEIQQTNDIFFPKIWLDAVLSGHNSPEAAKLVTDWLSQHPDISPNLKAKLLQSADMLFRAAGKK